MKYIIKFFLAGVLLSVFGCQKDDICPAGTETTQLLEIEFYDVDDPSTLKVVRDLTVIAVGEEDTLVKSVTINNLKIPLRTNENTTQYLFIKDSGEETENKDTINFNYNPSLKYLNRACGYKVDFLDLGITRSSNMEENWIKSDVIEQQNPEDETAPHISFTH